MTVSSSNDEVRRLIAMDQGIDSELGIVGLGYSPDNGLHFFVTNTIKGRVFRQKDADRLWPFMKGFVSRQIKESLVVTWDDIKGKPNVALKSDLPDLSGYALKDDLPAPVDLSGYAKADAVEAVKATSESALSNAEKAQSTADANSKALANKVNRDELPVVPTDLVHTAELNQAKADITKAKQMANDAVALANNARTIIDTSNIHQIKKPSEYSEGFSYEVKALSDLGIDLTKYDTSVQNGWIGLVKSVQVSVFNSVYVTQTVRVLGSYRPTTFIRNGSGDSWYPWELITTW
ncbi:hypothetical protein [Limosilactobacillus oris]|uniref:hypothetical protein n=1 Tax=Limosilactobacillus oris TaxID=1632 RepID=UPI001749310C|nr:hypothetical protein [Limosilactobacillus oris]